jgi:hypothetical protein|tara:strand:+ start:123 stop:317 length:195 start_codon:yes stop_codon:yes gene_type:complete
MSYAIIDANTSIDWADVVEEQGYERWSLDNTKFLVEFIGEIPSWVTNETILTQEEARQRVASDF